MSTPRLYAISHYLYPIPYTKTTTVACRDVTADRVSPSDQVHLADAREPDCGAGGGCGGVGALESQGEPTRAGRTKHIGLGRHQLNRRMMRYDERQEAVAGSHDAIDDVEILVVVVAYECADVGSAGSCISRTRRARLTPCWGGCDLRRAHLVGEINLRHRVRQRTGIDRAEVARHEDAEVLIRKTQNVRFVTHERAAVLHGAQPARRTDLVAEGVRQRVAVGEHAARVDQSLERVAADLLRIDVFVLLSQI